MKKSAMLETLDGVDVLIRNHPFLSGLEPQFYEIFSACSSLRRFAPHQEIFHEGGTADHFYLIVAGKVMLQTLVPECGKLAIQELGAGDALGWSWLFPPYKCHFTAITGAPTEVISCNAERLRAEAEKNCEFRAEMLSRVANTLFERLRFTRLRLIDSYRLSA